MEIQGGYRKVKAIILLAGMGTRLGKVLPKCLSELPDGNTILGRQISILKRYCDEIIGVVGFKKEIIMEMYPDILYVYNPFFTQTNTSKSLLLALKSIKRDDVLWVNGDVVFDEGIVSGIISGRSNQVAVQYKEKSGDEEIKFTVDNENRIYKISKTLPESCGEGIGINMILKDDIPAFIDCLEACHNNDFFERAIELGYKTGIRFSPFNATDYRCIEVDFFNDLEDVWKLFSDGKINNIRI
jgi:choline kinase